MPTPRTNDNARENARKAINIAVRNDADDAEKFIAALFREARNAALDEAEDVALWQMRQGQNEAAVCLAIRQLKDTTKE